MWLIWCVLYGISTSWMMETPVNIDLSPVTTSHFTENVSVSPTVYDHYEAFGLQTVLDFEVFELAYEGFQKLQPQRQDRLTIIDFSKPSSEKRMWVLDMQKHRVIHHTIVSHGRNSGELYAKKFSNIHGSFQSSLGFYKTAHPYQGGNGYSLVLEGLEKGINDQAKARAVVMHGADYCSEAIIRQTGRLGRSYGCPALPREINKKVIDDIKHGSILFIYAPDATYLAQSKTIKDLRQDQFKTL
jgi:hypothetical protein